MTTAMTTAEPQSVDTIKPTSSRAQMLTEEFNYKGRCERLRGKFWMESYPPYEQLYSNILHHRNMRVCALAGEGERMLDIGCGLGDMLYLLRDRFDELHGADPSRDMIESSRHNLVQRGLAGRFHLHWTPAEELDAPRSHFDTILMLDTYEHVHVDKRAKALARVREALKPGGRFILVTPSWARIHAMAAIDNMLTLPRQIRAKHRIRLFSTTPKQYTEAFCSKRSLLRHLRNADLKAQRFERVSFYPAPERQGFLGPYMHKIYAKPRLQGALECSFQTIQRLHVFNQKMLVVCE